jgi:hypothetical protein
MIFLAKLGIGVMGTTLAAGAALFSQGVIHVRVHEKHAGGTNINLVMPAALVSATLRFVPNDHLANASQELRPYLPIIDAAIPALVDCPDGELVEVVDNSDRVIFAKSSGSLVVDVKDANDTVHVSVPLRAAQTSIHLIAEANEPR